MEKPITIEFEGKKIRAFGSSVFWTDPNKTFHEFLIQVVASVFGQAWYQVEKGKSEAKRHEIAKWYISYCDFTSSQIGSAEKKGNWYYSQPSGDVWSLLTFGYDLFSLIQAMSLDGELKKRLMIRSQFKGARYELAVAAFIVRAGFKIEWIKRENSCEFTAHHPLLDESIAVEAKSRHRDENIHNASEILTDNVNVGVVDLFKKALKKTKEGIPYVVFIDINLPIEPGKTPFQKGWWKEVSCALGARARKNPAVPDEWNALFLTNFSYHYQGKGLINSPEYLGDKCLIKSMNPEVPFKDSGTLSSIDAAVSSYGEIPNDW